MAITLHSRNIQNRNDCKRTPGFLSVAKSAQTVRTDIILAKLDYAGEDLILAEGFKSSYYLKNNTL